MILRRLLIKIWWSRWRCIWWIIMDWTWISSSSLKPWTLIILWIFWILWFFKCRGHRFTLIDRSWFWNIFRIWWIYSLILRLIVFILSLRIGISVIVLTSWWIMIIFLRIIHVILIGLIGIRRLFWIKVFVVTKAYLPFSCFGGLLF